MATKKNSLLQHMRSELDEARRQLGLAAMDFSTPDDRLLELRSNLRRQQDEVAAMERKSKKLFGIF
jgi:hypothetical protein